MVYLGADHRGFELKEQLKSHLHDRAIPFEDLGAKTLAPDDDFVDYALAVAQAVARDPEEHMGIVLCGSGAGVDIVANKVKGIRGALLFLPTQAADARRDDAINVVALSADHLSIRDTNAIIDQCLDTPVSAEEHHRRRVQKISAWEDQVFK